MVALFSIDFESSNAFRASDVCFKDGLNLDISTPCVSPFPARTASVPDLPHASHPDPRHFLIFFFRFPLLLFRNDVSFCTSLNFTLTATAAPRTGPAMSQSISALLLLLLR